MRSAPESWTWRRCSRVRSLVQTIAGDERAFGRSGRQQFLRGPRFQRVGQPLSSPVLREAVMMALNRAGMATELLGPYGLATTIVDNRVYLPRRARVRTRRGEL